MQTDTGHPSIGDRHPLPPTAYWREREAGSARRQERLAASGRVDLLERMAVELDLGLLRAFLAESPGSAAGHLTMAMDCGAALALARVVAGRGGFQVELRWPAPDAGQDYIRLPAADNGFGWPQWLDAFALALLANDAQDLALLGSAACVDACALPFDRVDRFWPLLCGALAALWQRHPSVSALLDDAGGLLQQTRVMDPARAVALIGPLVPLARAIAAGDAGAVAPAAAAALVARRDWLAAQPDGGRDPDALFALPLSALLAEAARRGLEPLPSSDYRLATFQRPQPPAELVLLYPRLGILSAVEADWLLQNEGFARHDRSTLVQAADGRLVARYRAFDATGIPAAELEFELIDAERDAIYDGSHAPPALDVGELLHHAEVLASKPHAGPGGAPVYDLTQAVEAMDLALTYVDAMPASFDPATLHSDVGQRLWREEPGRFRHERMRVYRDALAREGGLRESPRAEAATAATGPAADRPTPPPPEVARRQSPSSPDTRERALALAEALTPLVLPLLQSIARDSDGGVVRGLLPRDADYALAFTGEAVTAAREHYADGWSRQLTEGRPASVDPGWRIEAHLAPAGMLGSDNPLSRPFPRGYREIADWLDPHRVWVAWKYLPQGAGSGIAMNGLVWIDDHWAWFPKPYRLVNLLRRH